MVKTPSVHKQSIEPSKFSLTTLPGIIPSYFLFDLIFASRIEIFFSFKKQKASKFNPLDPLIIL